MSATPNAADDVRKLLDNGYTVVLRLCGLGSYFAVAVRDGTEAATVLGDAIDAVIGWDGIDPAPDGDTVGRDFDEAMPGVVETDDFTPTQVLYRLTEKATRGRIAGLPPPDADVE